MWSIDKSMKYYFEVHWHYNKIFSSEKMFSKLIKKQFSTAVQKDLLSTKNMKKFLVGDFPAAL